MSEYLIQGSTLTGIADAIRGKTGASEAIKVSDMASQIDNIDTYVEPALQEKTVNPGTSAVEVTPDTNYDGLGKVTVNAVALQEKSVTPGEEALEVTPDSGYLGLSKVTVGVVQSGGNGATKEIVPDFSEGDQTVNAGEDELWNEVIVKKPETLIPENIAKGIDIAGILGTLEISADADALKFASGTFGGTGSIATVTHNLGVVPDIFAFAASFTTASKNQILMAYGMSKAFLDKVGESYGIRYVYGRTTSPYHGSSTLSAGIDKATSILYGAGTTTIKIGSSTYPPLSGTVFSWIAIGGLT